MYLKVTLRKLICLQSFIEKDRGIHLNKEDGMVGGVKNPLREWSLPKDLKKGRTSVTESCLTWFFNLI